MYSYFNGIIIILNYIYHKNYFIRYITIIIIIIIDKSCNIYTCFIIKYYFNIIESNVSQGSHRGNWTDRRRDKVVS